MTETRANFSTRACVALALLVGEPRPEHFSANDFSERVGALGELTERVALVHDWRYTVALLRGVDAALDYPGRPGIYGMSASHRTMTRFHALTGAPSGVSVREFPGMLRLGEDTRYLLARYLAGFRARLPFRSQRARDAYFSSDRDLARFTFAAGARVELDVGGTKASEEVRLPPGFAGDPGREAVARGKLTRELQRSLSPERAASLFDLLTAPWPSAQALRAWAEDQPPEARAARLVP
jgi:2-methylcitrate dehydratase PrpD